MEQIKKLIKNKKTIIIIIYIIATVIFNIKINYYQETINEFPDESSHIAYIAYLEETKKIIPEFEGYFATTKISCEEYYKTYSKEWINVLVGDVQRMKLYPKFGWQIEVEMPDNVWKAFEELVKLGYNKYVLK